MIARPPGVLTARALGALRALGAVVLVVGLAACSSSGAGRSASTTAGTSASTTSTTTTTTTTLGLAPAGGTYGVGRSDIVLVDESRGTDADPTNDVAARPDRTLETVLLYPTEDPEADATDDTQGVAEGRFPLVVFSHGVTANGPSYVGILADLAAAGYVVALPTFPLTSGPGGWGNLGQTTNQPGDVSFIITKLLERSETGDELLGDHLAPQAVAVGGHSLGAITSALFYNTCCRDERVAAVVALSGIVFPGPEPSDTYDDPPAEVPLLMLHGTADSTLSYEDGSAKTFDTFTDLPRALVAFPDAGHVDLLGSPSLMPAIIAFLDLNLRGDPDDWEALSDTIDANGDATIEVAGGLPEPTG